MLNRKGDSIRDNLKLPDVKTLATIFCLNNVNGFGPTKFRELHELRISPESVLENPLNIPFRGKVREKLVEGIRFMSEVEKETALKRAEAQIEKARRDNIHILTYASPWYPLNVYESNNPVPILWAKGNLEILKDRKVVACVGTRKIRAPYDKLHKEFAIFACKNGFIISSGFATGADRLGHEASQTCNGRNLCVMPSGLDRPFPPENRKLWDELLSKNENDTVFISEFPISMAASSLSLRKRNKLIVASSLGVMISQTSDTGGAMNAFRFAKEQKKPIATFRQENNVPDTSGNRFISDNYSLATTFSTDSSNERVYQSWLEKLLSSI